MKYTPIFEDKDHTIADLTDMITDLLLLQGEYFANPTEENRLSILSYVLENLMPYATEMANQQEKASYERN